MSWKTRHTAEFQVRTRADDFVASAFNREAAEHYALVGRERFVYRWDRRNQSYYVYAHFIKGIKQ